MRLLEFAAIGRNVSRELWPMGVSIEAQVHLLLDHSLLYPSLPEVLRHLVYRLLPVELRIKEGV